METPLGLFEFLAPRGKSAALVEEGAAGNGTGAGSAPAADNGDQHQGKNFFSFMINDQPEISGVSQGSARQPQDAGQKEGKATAPSMSGNADKVTPPASLNFTRVSSIPSVEKSEAPVFFQTSQPMVIDHQTDMFRGDDAVLPVAYKKAFDQKFVSETSPGQFFSRDIFQGNEADSFGPKLKHSQPTGDLTGLAPQRNYDAQETIKPAVADKPAAVRLEAAPSFHERGVDQTDLRMPAAIGDSDQRLASTSRDIAIGTQKTDAMPTHSGEKVTGSDHTPAPLVQTDRDISYAVTHDLTQQSDEKNRPLVAQMAERGFKDLEISSIKHDIDGQAGNKPESVASPMSEKMTEKFIQQQPVENIIPSAVKDDVKTTPINEKTTAPEIVNKANPEQGRPMVAASSVSLPAGAAFHQGDIGIAPTEISDGPRLKPDTADILPEKSAARSASHMMPAATTPVISSAASMIENPFGKGLANGEPPVGQLLGADPLLSDKAMGLAAASKFSPPLNMTTPLAAMPLPVAIQIAAAATADGAGDVVDIRLDPPELGRVRISFSMEAGESIKAVLAAELNTTLDHLKKHSETLLKQLEDAGFTSIDLEFSSNDSDAYAEFENANGGFDIGVDIESAPSSDIVYLSLDQTSVLDVRV